MRRMLLSLAALVLGTTTAWAQTDPVVEYYHLDAVGSVRAVTNAQRDVVRVHAYHPFGHGDGVAAGTDAIRFTGQERDAETGLDYFGARYYASRTGRFTTIDPVLNLDAASTDPQRWNRYAYGLNNPLRKVDPDGRDTIDLAIGFGQGIWNAAKGIVTLPYAVATNPSGVANAIAHDIRLLGYGLANPGEVLDAYVSLSVSANDAEQRALGAAIGEGTAGAALAFAPTAKGAPAQVQLNRAAGNAFRDEIANALRQSGRGVQTEVYKKTPFGPRHIDIEVSQGGKVLGGVETKTGGSRYTPAQRAKDRYLRDVQGYPVNVVRDR